MIQPLVPLSLRTKQHRAYSPAGWPQKVATTKLSKITLNRIKGFQWDYISLSK